MVLIPVVANEPRDFLGPGRMEVLAWSGADLVRRTLLERARHDGQSANLDESRSDWRSDSSIGDRSHFLRIALRSSGYVQLLIGGARHWALLDTQATANIMSIKVAEQHNLHVQRTRTPFRMLDGSFQLSLGTVWVECCLDHQKLSTRPRQFYVFESLTAPLLLGLPFLSEICHASEQHFHQIVNKSLYPGVTLSFTASGEIHVAAVDSGAESNLMSYKFAKKADLAVHPLEKRRLRMGNGASVPIIGYVETDVYLPMRERSRRLLRNCKFLILEALPYEVGVGRAMITKYGLLQRSYEMTSWTIIHRDDFVLFSITGGPFHASKYARFIPEKLCGKIKCRAAQAAAQELVQKLRGELEEADKASDGAEKLGASAEVLGALLNKMNDLAGQLSEAERDLEKKEMAVGYTPFTPETYSTQQRGQDIPKGSKGGQRARQYLDTKSATPRMSQSSSRYINSNGKT